MSVPAAGPSSGYGGGGGGGSSGGLTALEGAYDEPMPVLSPATTVAGAASGPANEVVVIRRCLEDSGILSSTDGTMSVAEMRSYVHGRIVQ